MTRSLEDEVQAQIRHLRKHPYRQLGMEVAQKRKAWARKHLSDKPVGRPSPRDAYELLLLRYLGLSKDDVPIIEETGDKIIWHSLNRCSTLEACQQLQEDTRMVCRRIYEKSTQALVSELDPQLRFWRSYEEIRPHAPYCKEGIFRLHFGQMMRLAIEQARIARREGNKGYGAVLAMGGQVVATGRDGSMTQRDPSLHAEFTAIRKAAESLGDGDLSGGVLFSTCEPCPMCASLSVWANLSAIIYGASIEATARLGKARILISCREVVRRSPVWMEVIGGVLEEECMVLYQ
jgi:tRNA(Arg) A34 adenosine deaminase TadA